MEGRCLAGTVLPAAGNVFLGKIAFVGMELPLSGDKTLPYAWLPPTFTSLTGIPIPPSLHPSRSRDLPRAPRGWGSDVV